MVNACIEVKYIVAAAGGMLMTCVVFAVVCVWILKKVGGKNG